MCEFTPPEKKDLIFKQKYEAFNFFWSKKFQWLLFKPLRKEDSHFFKTLRIPLINSRPEFEDQVLALTKVLIDSLNEKALKKYIEFTEKENMKDISKFEEFLKVNKLSDYKNHITFLRDLQELRSSGVAHRKSEKYVKIARKFEINRKNLIEVFEEILSKAISLLDYLIIKFRLAN